jgi:hypothetical protein
MDDDAVLITLDRWRGGPRSWNGQCWCENEQTKAESETLLSGPDLVAFLKSESSKRVAPSAMCVHARVPGFEKQPSTTTVTLFINPPKENRLNVRVAQWTDEAG